MGYPYGNAVSSEKPNRGALRCSVCKQPADKFVKIEEAAPVKNPYAGTWYCPENGMIKAARNFDRAAFIVR